MTTQQKERVTSLRKQGIGYKRIAASTGISLYTVKSFCRRNGLTGQDMPALLNVCQNCGEPLKQKLIGRKKKFCCSECRNTWWNTHQELVNRKANYEFVCLTCKKPFTAYGDAQRKYCSRACYYENRYGGTRYE